MFSYMRQGKVLLLAICRAWDENERSCLGRLRRILHSGTGGTTIWIDPERCLSLYSSASRTYQEGRGDHYGAPRRPQGDACLIECGLATREGQVIENLT